MTPSVATAPQLAAIYTRISSDDDTRIKGLGVARQEKSCRALVESAGWELVDIYSDNNLSASKVGVERPDFQRMLADLRDGRVNRVVVLSQDRLTRQPEELECTMRLLRSLGIDEISSVSDGVVRVASASGKLMTRIEGSMDAYYADYISEKVSLKKDELAEKGVPSGGGTRPFGYEKDRVTVVPAEAELVAEAARRVLAGESLYSICVDWKARGVRTVTGAPWLPNVLRGMLSSPRVAGLRQHRGDVIGAATWDALVDRDTWDRLLVIFASRSDREARGGRRKALLTGLLRCGLCGEVLSHGINNGKGAYFCRKAPGQVGCGKLAVIGLPVEDIIAEAVMVALDTPRLDQAVRDHEHTGGDDLAAIEAQLTELAALWGEGSIDRAQWTAAKRPLDRRLAEARAKIEATVTVAVAAPYIAAPGLLREQWPAMTTDQRRGVLAAVVESVSVAPAPVRGRHTFDQDRLTITWRA